MARKVSSFENLGASERCRQTNRHTSYFDSAGSCSLSTEIELKKHFVLWPRVVLAVDSGKLVEYNTQPIGTKQKPHYKGDKRDRGIFISAHREEQHNQNKNKKQPRVPIYRYPLRALFLARTVLAYGRSQEVEEVRHALP